MSWLSKLFFTFRPDPKRLMPESEFVVEYDDQSVTLSHPKRQAESVQWSDLQQVEIVTTDDSPWACDWYWVLHGLSSGIAVPQGTTGEAGLLQRLQKLPGFDSGAVLRAGTANHHVTCWKKHAAQAEPGASPNGGPATPSGNSGVTEGPPSVS